MTVVNQDILLLTTAGMKTDFWAAYHKAAETPEWQMIASELGTTLPIQYYAWLGRGAVMQLLVDEPADQGVIQKSYNLADNIYKARLKVKRGTIEDDQYGQLMMDARALGAEPVRHWNELAYTTLATGFSNTCYDGQFFFSASHSEGQSGTQSNLLSGTNLTSDNLALAHALMTAYLDDKGKPFRARGTTLVVGPALEQRAWELVGSPANVHKPGDGTAGSGATAFTPYSNFFYGKYNVVVNPYLVGTSAFYWFLLDTSREVKPVIIQNRSDVPITLETDMDQPMAMMQEEFRFDARGRYVPGYGLWQLAVGASGTA